MRRTRAPPPELPVSDLAAIANHAETSQIVRTYFPWMEAELAEYAAASPARGRFSFRGWLKKAS